MRQTSDLHRTLFSNHRVRGITLAVGLMVALGAISPGLADEPARFGSAEDAVKALLDAAKAADREGLSKIFGSAVEDLLSGDEVQDKADFEVFSKRLAEAHRLLKSEDGSMTLSVGKNDHPFPIPIVQKDGQWFFDTIAGKEEILNRRVGTNELSTISVCRAYVVAQREYAQKDWDGDGVLEYAQKLKSTAGQRDGLYWDSLEGDALSPMGSLVADARAEGYGAPNSSAANEPRPYHGYVFKVLTSQGDKTPGGKYDYILNGNMVAGYGLVAYPIEWGSSGIMTFQVAPNGKVYEKDLGEQTAAAVAGINTVNLDETWQPSEE